MPTEPTQSGQSFVELLVEVLRQVLELGLLELHHVLGGMVTCAQCPPPC